VSEKIDFLKVYSDAKKIQSYVTPNQCKILFDMAKSSKGTIIELGSWLGRSTGVLTAGAGLNPRQPQVFAVDTWKNCDVFPYKDFYRDWEYNMKGLGIRSYVTEIRMDSADAADSYNKHLMKPYGKVGLLFIDAWHTYEAVQRDFHAWLPYIKQGGFIILHDVEESFPEIMRFVQDMEKNKDMFKITVTDKIAIFEVK